MSGLTEREMASPSLTDFLLARIADDEEWARARLADGDTASHLEHRVDGTLIALSPSPRVALEDMAAKRRIVEMQDWPGPPEANGYIDAILRVLAAAYADHPDYRQEWKP